MSRLAAEDNRPRTPFWNGLLFQVSLWGAIFGLTGAGYLGWVDPPDPDGRGLVRGWTGFVVGIAGVLGGLIILEQSSRLGQRRLLLQTMFFICLCVVSIAVMEMVLRITIPPWPARDLQGFLPLHASTPSVTPKSTGIENHSSRNSWGQIDREHPISPEPGRPRIVLLGDSFLDEVDGASLSVRLEKKLSESRCEVLNLGVSATGPDEYFHRFRRIALRLEPEHCVFFIYAGNDFVGGAQTLKSWHGRTKLEQGSVVRNSILNIWYEKAEHGNPDLIREQLAEDQLRVPLKRVA